MKKFFIIASKRVEVRGLVFAKTEKDARAMMRASWYLYDTSKGVSAGSSLPPSPILSEMDDIFRVLHVKDVSDEDGVLYVGCPECGADINMNCRVIGTRDKMLGFHKGRFDEYNKAVKEFKKDVHIEGASVVYPDA